MYQELKQNWPTDRQQCTTSHATKGGEKKQKQSTFRYVYRSGLGAQWTLRQKETKVTTSNIIDTMANLRKQFEDFYNLEFNDLSYEPKMSMS